MSTTIRSTVNLELQNSFLKVEENFFAAVVQDSTALSDFSESWNALQERFQEAQNSALLDEETISLAHTVSLNLTLLGKGFLEVQNTSASWALQLTLEWNAILDEIPREDNKFCQDRLPTRCHERPVESSRVLKPFLQPPRHPTATPITSALAIIIPSRIPSNSSSITESSRSASDPNPLPEFIKHAYKFFVANIFNPYPTREEKQTIVNNTNNSRVTITSVSTWFTNARRRCGWAEILKRRYDGNREKMINIATRVFINPDPRHPVDPEVVTEMMKMKESVEAMYERKTRTSAWIEEIEEMAELINSIPKEERPAAKKRQAEEEREARRKQKEMLKERRDFERRKRKVQAKALRKAEKVTKLQRQQEKRKEPLFIMSSPPAGMNERASDPEPRLVAGGKRKLNDDDSGSYDVSGARHVSPASSSYNSDTSSDGRVPSLTWSDSGDERPCKRSRSSSSTAHTNTLPLSPALEIPASFNYSFTIDPPTGLTYDPAVYNSIFDFPITTSEDCAVAPPRGQKRIRDADDEDATPQDKRAKAIVASSGPELAPAPSTPLFTPTPSAIGSPREPISRRLNFSLVDLDAALGLVNTNPQPVQSTLPDSLPLEIGVFDWSTCPNPPISLQGASGTEDLSDDFTQLFQWIKEQPPPVFEASEHTEQRLDAQLEVPSFDLSTSDFMLQHSALATSSDSQLEEGHNLDFSGLMSDFMSETALNDLGASFPESTPPDFSRSSSVSQSWTSAPATPSETSPTPAELAQKARDKELKRKQVEEKKAALKRQLAELERELECD